MDRIEPSQTERRKDAVKEVLDLQYSLHEPGRHFAEAAEGPTVVEPVAHTVCDIYKCLHQSAFGVGHSIDNPRDFKLRLNHELLRPPIAFTEPLLEKVSADGSVLRVNLRPFRDVFAGDEETGSDLLARVCLESAAIETGSIADFFFSLDLFTTLNGSGELTAGRLIFCFPQRLVEQFLREIGRLAASAGAIPVLSHSAIYRKFNNPSYRVVHLKALMRSPLAALLDSPRSGGPGYAN